MKRVAAILSAGIPLLLACVRPPPLPPGPPPSPEYDGGGVADAFSSDADFSSAACESLRRAGCEEGFDVNCEAVFKLAEETKLINLHAECVAKSANPTECGKEISCTRSRAPGGTT